MKKFLKSLFLIIVIILSYFGGFLVLEGSLDDSVLSHLLYFSFGFLLLIAISGVSYFLIMVTNEIFGD